MTRYLSITPKQSNPIDISPDAKGRPRVSVNFDIIKVPSETMEEEIGMYLASGGLGTWGATVLGSTGATLPPTGSAVTVISAVGSGPKYVQDVAGPRYQMSSVQVIARADTYAAARHLGWLAINLLGQVRNQDV